MTAETRISPIECGGSNHEIGRAYGRARGAELGLALDAFFELFQLIPERPGRDQVCAAAENLLRNAKRVLPDQVAFIRGQADGAEVDFREMFAQHCFLELLFHYRAVTAMCTSFALTGPATVGGQTIVGQNVDWFCSSPIDLLHMEHEDGGRCFAVCLSGVPLYFLTSAGLANAANLTLGPPRMDEGRVPATLCIAASMRRASLDEALAVFRDSVGGLAYCHYADGNGRMAGIESLGGDHEQLLPENGVLTHSNHYETARFQAEDWSEQVVPCTKNRGERIRALVRERFGQLTPEVMMEIMRDHQNHPSGLCRHRDPDAPEVAASETRASIIMTPADRTMRVAFGTPCEREYHTYTLDG